MKKPLHERIAAAERRKAELAARLAALKGKAKAVDRKRDTRRKIVVGAVVLVEMQRDPKFAAYVRKMLGKAVTRPQDRDAIADLLPAAAAEITAPAVNRNAPLAPAPAEVTGEGASPVPPGFPIMVREQTVG